MFLLFLLWIYLGHLLITTGVICTEHWKSGKNYTEQIKTKKKNKKIKRNTKEKWGRARTNKTATTMFNVSNRNVSHYTWSDYNNWSENTANRTAKNWFIIGREKEQMRLTPKHLMMCVVLFIPPVSFYYTNFAMILSIVGATTGAAAVAVAWMFVTDLIETDWNHLWMKWIWLNLNLNIKKNCIAIELDWFKVAWAHMSIPKKPVQQTNNEQIQWKRNEMKWCSAAAARECIHQYDLDLIGIYNVRLFPDASKDAFPVRKYRSFCTKQLLFFFRFGVVARTDRTVKMCSGVSLNNHHFNKPIWYNFFFSKEIRSINSQHFIEIFLVFHI